MDRADASIIGFVETAYDLDIDDESWLPSLLEKGRHAMDRGLGVAGVLYGRPLHGGPVELLQIDTLGCPEDFAERHLRAIAAIPYEVLREQSRPGQAGTMSENSRQPETDLARYRTHVPYCRDVLGITAVDPNGSGAAIVVPLQEKTTLTGRARARWQMMGAHVCAAHRLRQSLSRESDETVELTSRSEAIVDPAGFRIVDASGDARTATSRRQLRSAAMRIDRARGFLGEQDAEAALELWKALVDGRGLSSTGSTRTSAGSSSHSRTLRNSVTRVG